MRVGFGIENPSYSLSFTDRNQMKTMQKLLAKSESIWGWEVQPTSWGNAEGQPGHQQVDHVFTANF